MILHSLNQRLDSLAAKVVADDAFRGQPIGLVDEQHAIESSLDGLVGLVRSMANVLADQACPIDLDQVTFLQQPQRTVHLAKKPSDGRLAGPRVAQKHEVLTRRHLSKPMILSPSLNLQKGDLGTNLFFDQLEPNERVQVGLDLFKRAWTAR